MIPTFPTFSSHAAQEICNHLWQSTPFALVVALLALALRRYPARARYWLWMTASAKFLIPFSLLIAAGSHLARPTHATLTQTSAYVAIDEMSQPFTSTFGPQTIPIAPQSMPSHHILTLSAILVALWLCGLLTVLTRWLIEWSRIAVAIRNATPIQHGRVAETLRRIQRLAEIKRPIAVLSSTGSMEPGVFGVFRPVLLWPEAISRHLDDAHLEAVLAHEAAHVRRRDNLTSLLHMLVEAVFWFHPLVWWMESQLVKERERACDEEVLLLCHQPKAYAESIVKVCELCIESPLTCVSGITGADLKRRIVQIMTGRVVRKLGLGSKLLLLAAAAAVVAAPVALGLAHRPLVLGQILHADGRLPSFEVASVRPFKGSVGPPPSLPGTGAPVRKQAASEGADFHSIEPTKFLIGSAYNIPMSFLEAQIVGGPKWIDTDSYEIRGKIEQNMKAAMDKMPREQRQRQMQLMEQSLLADRFKLKVHFETRELPEWALVIAKGSPKLTPVKALPEDTVNSPISSPGWQLGDFKKGMLFLPKGHGTEMTARSVTLDELVHEVVIVSDPALGGRVVVNQTGLSGTYDFTLRFGVEQPTTTGGEDVADDAPPLLTAVQQQLGLKLVPTKGPVEVLVIDSIEKPVPQDEARFVGPGPTLPTRVVPGEGQVLAPPSAGLMPVALAQIGAAQANPPNGSVAESPIARVNGQVIGRGDYERAQQQLLQEAQRDHVSQAELEKRQNDLLRNLIDQRLLLQRGKELNISPDAEVAREMDAIRTTNHLATTADLERAVGSSGTSIEDFKANLRNTIIVRTVVSDEVAPNLRITTSQEQAYYDQHKQDFAQPEQVRLSEILIPTPDNPTDFQITQAQSQADQIVAKLKAGASFEALARQYSSGPNAATGGDLGAFGPGTLPKPLADQTASLKPGEVTAPVRTRQGFVLLKVTEYQAAGTPPFSVLENQVKSAMYEKAIQPALRTYLTALRAKARIEIAPGFVDTGSSAK